MSFYPFVGGLKKVKTCYHLTLLLICLVFPVNMFGQTTSNDLEKLFNNHKVIICAHRGLTKNAPENSLKAIKDAIENNIDAVEIDIRITSDGIPVLMHDETVNRTTNGKGKVSELNFLEIRKLRLDKSNLVVPTLEEVLKVAKGKIILYLDIKTDNLKPVISLIQKYDAYDWTILHGGVNKIIRLHKIDKKLQLTVRSNTESELKNLLQKLRPSMIEVDNIPSIDYSILLHRKGIHIEIDFMGPRDFFIRYIGIKWFLKKTIRNGVDFIMTDYPLFLLRNTE